MAKPYPALLERLGWQSGQALRRGLNQAHEAVSTRTGAFSVIRVPCLEVKFPPEGRFFPDFF